MALFEIIKVIIETFSNEKNNEFIDKKIEKVIIDNTKITPDMALLARVISSLNSNMKIEKIYNYSIIIKFNNVYCWITYYRNNEKIINYVVKGYLSMDEIINEILKNNYINLKV